MVFGAPLAPETEALLNREGTKEGDTVFAISDNYESPSQFEGRRSRTPFSGSLVAYKDSTKLELTLPDRQITAFDVSRIQAEEVPLEVQDREVRTLLDRLSDIASRQLSEIRSPNAGAWARIAAWGYDS
jgi:hypothetical protein